MKRMSWLIAGLLISIAGLTTAAEPKVGDDAPDFTMVGSDGKTYKLSDFKGKQAVVIAWFPRAFTGGCTKECTSFKNDGAKMREFEVAYFTASNDPVAKNTEFAKSLEADYPILSDPDSSVAAKYGVLNTERKAAFRWTFYIGADGKVLHIDKAVKTEAHGADVAAKLAELGVAKKKK
jgi:peroxiredoxin Q/BCP